MGVADRADNVCVVCWRRAVNGRMDDVGNAAVVELAATTPALEDVSLSCASVPATSRLCVLPFPVLPSFRFPVCLPRYPFLSFVNGFVLSWCSWSLVLDGLC